MFAWKTATPSTSQGWKLFGRNVTQEANDSESTSLSGDDKLRGVSFFFLFFFLSKFDVYKRVTCVYGVVKLYIVIRFFAESNIHDGFSVE